MGFFADTIHQFAPSWFQAPYMTTLMRAFAGELDVFEQRVFDGRRAAIPYAGGSRVDSGVHAGVLRQCDPDVLEWHARDRGIRLYDTEPEISKRVRLGSWRQLKRRRGSHQGEMRNLHPYFLDQPALPKMRIVHQSNHPTPVATWHTLDSAGVYSVHRATPSNWNWDDVPEKRARFWLIIYTDQLSVPSPAQNVWDGPQEWDGGSIWGGLLTRAQMDDIVSMIREAKAAHSVLWGVIFATDPASFDPASTLVVDPDGWSNLPNGKWGSVIDDDTGQPTRLPTAVFAYDLGQG